LNRKIEDYTIYNNTSREELKIIQFIYLNILL